MRATCEGGNLRRGERKGLAERDIPIPQQDEKKLQTVEQKREEVNIKIRPRKDNRKRNTASKKKKPKTS